MEPRLIVLGGKECVINFRNSLYKCGSKHKYSTMISCIIQSWLCFSSFLTVFKESTCHETPIPTTSRIKGIYQIDQKRTAEIVRVIHNVAMVRSFAFLVMPRFSV